MENMGDLTLVFLVPILMTFLVVGVVTVLIVWLVRSGMFGKSKAKQQRANQLQATGSKARAMIVAVQPTGMVVNNIYVRSVVHFRLEPLDGSAPFESSKTIMLAQTNMPRVGDVWPAWYDPTNPTEIAVGQIEALTSDQIPMFREFGIPHPLDTTPGAPPPGAPAAGPPTGPPVDPPPADRSDTG
jgi:hypothetical protein